MILVLQTRFAPKAAPAEDPDPEAEIDIASSKKGPQVTSSKGGELQVHFARHLRLISLKAQDLTSN